MPIGLHRAPPTFQRLMNAVLVDFIKMVVNVYVDNVLVAPETFLEHLDLLRKVYAAAQLQVEAQVVKDGMVQVRDKISRTHYY